MGVLAHANNNWIQVKASFPLEEIDLDEDDAGMTGRLLAGVITAAQGQAEIATKLGLTVQQRSEEQDA